MMLMVWDCLHWCNFRSNKVFALLKSEKLNLSSLLSLGQLASGDIISLSS